MITYEELQAQVRMYRASGQLFEPDSHMRKSWDREKLTPEMLERRVDAGVAWLDANLPGWVESIDLDRLNLSFGCSCILGQLHVDEYSGALWAWAPGRSDAKFAWAQEHGFSLRTAPYGGYQWLTEVWRERIEKRRADLP